VIGSFPHMCRPPRMCGRVLFRTLWALLRMRRARLQTCRSLSEIYTALCSCCVDFRALWQMCRALFADICGSFADIQGAFADV